MPGCLELRTHFFCSMLQPYSLNTSDVHSHVRLSDHLLLNCIAHLRCRQVVVNAIIACNLYESSCREAVTLFVPQHQYLQHYSVACLSNLVLNLCLCGTAVC